MVYFAQYLTNREKRVDWVLVGITGFFAFWGVSVRLRNKPLISKSKNISRFRNFLLNGFFY